MPGRDFDDELSRVLYNIRDWVYDNYHKAYLGGTLVLAYSLFYPNWLVFVVVWLGCLALGLALEPCVNPMNLRYGWGLVKGAPEQGMQVALTFDDGPGPDTGKVLDLLAHHNVRATFFCIGRQAEQHPALVRRIAAEGHVVANHSWTHPNLMLASPTRTSQELGETQRLLGDLSGAAPRFFRHPYGFRAPWTQAVLKQLGLTSVLWSVNPRDFQNPGSSVIVKRVLDVLSPGAIVLLHDGPGDRSQTLAALEQLIPALKEQGYSFVTPVEMAGK